MGWSTPLLHIDLHGMVSRPNYCEVGTAALKHVWSDLGEFVDELTNKFGVALDAALQRNQVSNFNGTLLTVDTHPPVNHGLWGEGVMRTMSHQSALLGIPSIQLEMPPA